MIYRMLFLSFTLFCCFYGILHLCFTRGFLTRQRLRKLNRIIAIVFMAIVLAAVVFSMLAGVDKTI